MRVLRNFFRARPIGPDGQPYRRSFWRALGRLVIWLALTATLFVATIVGGILSYEYFTYDLPKSQIAVTVERNPSICTEPTFPILVHVANNSSRRVLGYTVYPSARRPGRSTNLAEILEPFESDHIIEPGARISLCYAMSVKRYLRNSGDADRPEDSAWRNLDWGVNSFWVKFENR